MSIGQMGMMCGDIEILGKYHGTQIKFELINHLYYLVDGHVQQAGDDIFMTVGQTRVTSKYVGFRQRLF